MIQLFLDLTALTAVTRKCTCRFDKVQAEISLIQSQIATFAGKGKQSMQSACASVCAHMSGVIFSVFHYISMLIY